MPGRFPRLRGRKNVYLCSLSTIYLMALIVNRDIVRSTIVSELDWSCFFLPQLGFIKKLICRTTADRPGFVPYNCVCG
jgi:hypothetical protein